MASIKLLKKKITALADDLATACLLSKAELDETDVPKVNAVLAEIYNFEDEFRQRAHHYDAKENPKLVKKYFNKLYSDLEEKALSIVDMIDELNK
ncbi:MAG: hypothetical protein RR202_02680 [Bacteroidales bacterium]